MPTTGATQKSSGGMGSPAKPRIIITTMRSFSSKASTVDLPPPEGPTSATNCPAWIDRLTPSSAGALFRFAVGSEDVETSAAAGFGDAAQTTGGHLAGVYE